MRKVRSLGGRKTVPVLVLEEQILYDSADILRWADARAKKRLYPEGKAGDSVTELDHSLAARYGVETRRLAYDYFFRNIRTCLPYNAGAAPGWQVGFLQMTRRLIQPKLEVYLGLTEKNLTEGLEFVRKTMDEIDTRLEDGRPHLFGDELTAADITFAALTSVLVLPEQYPVPLPPPESLDAPARELVAEIRERPAGRHALSLYARRPEVRARLPRPIREVQPRS